MANRFWVGGTAAWDATAGAKWSTTSGGVSGAAVPGSEDVVTFDVASGAAVVTITDFSEALRVITTGFTGSFVRQSKRAGVGLTAGLYQLSLGPGLV